MGRSTAAVSAAACWVMGVMSVVVGCHERERESKVRVDAC